jgi:hypothetical protein
MAGVALVAGVVAVRQTAWLRYWRREALVMGRMNKELIEENGMLFARVRAAEGKGEP